MSMPLSGKKALIVGATSAIGSELALRLASLGARLCLNAGPRSTRLAELCARTGAEALALDLDIQEQWPALLEKAAEVDLLCVVRGPFLQKPLHETTAPEWTALVTANLILPGILISRALEGMSERKWGRILLFGGTRTETIRGVKTNPAYAAAKTALSALVRSVALEYASQGITCNLICPGLVDTGNLEERERETLARKNPDGKLVSPGEIADAAVFLLQNGAANGILLPIDKGWAPVLI